jgi:hypothetical protein
MRHTDVELQRIYTGAVHKKHAKTDHNWTHRYNSKTLDFYSGGAWSKFLPGHILILLWFYSCPPTKCWIVLWIGYSYFLPSPFQFLSHPTILHYIVLLLTPLVNTNLRKLCHYNYRGISLFSAMYKIVSIILPSWLMPYIDEISKDYQFGFWHKGSPTGWIFRRFWEYSGRVNLLFLDFKTGYDLFSFNWVQWNLLC